MVTVQYETKRNGEPLFWVGRHGPHSIRIDANRPGVYRWIITRDARSVASGVAADPTRRPTMRPPPSVDCQASHWTWGTPGAQTGSAHRSTADNCGKQMIW
jgi:hypothetical protein